MVEENPVRARREYFERYIGKRVEVIGKKMIIGNIDDDPRHPARRHPEAAPPPHGMAVGKGIDAAMHADPRQQRGGGETIEPTFDKITSQVAGEQQGRLGGEPGMGEMVHGERLCVSPRRRV